MLTINGTGKSDHLVGTAADEQLLGLGGNDTLEGGGGFDELLGGGGSDKLFANGLSAEHFDGGSGKDTLIFSGPAAASVTIVDLQLGQGSSGLASGDSYKGIENVTGSAGTDSLLGSAAANQLSGGAGNDGLTGRGGKDVLFGDAGSDRFDFDAVSDSGVGSTKRDVIKDFSQAQGDGVQLAAIDADTGKAGFQHFTFIGDDGFNAAGQVRSFFEGNHTIVEVNNAGSDGAEMQIELSGHISLKSSDFIFDV